LVTWPVCRFGDVRKTYDVALPSSEARAVVRGAIGTDPLYLPVLEGIEANKRSDVVGSVDDDGRLQIYIGGKGGTGIGLVGRVSASGAGSRIETRVGWTSLHRWFEPALTVLAVAAPGAVVYRAIGESDGLILGLSLALAVMIGGGRLLALSSQASTARERELPAILERLDRALAPHRRERWRNG
jgi:hypothetical protein